VGSNSASVNDLLTVTLCCGTVQTQKFPTVSDNVSGAWNTPSQLNYFTTQTVGGGFFLAQIVAWVKVGVAGIPTISIAGLSTAFWTATISRYTGWINGPSLVTADISQNQGTGTALSSAALTNSAAVAEANISFANWVSGPTLGTLTGTYTNDVNDSGNTVLLGHDFTTSSGNALSQGGTFSSSTQWAIQLAGWADQSLNVASIAWVT